MLTGDFDEWVVRISTIIDWIRNAFKTRVGVHGLKYLKLLNEFFANRTCLILSGFLIFEHTVLSVFFMYVMEMV